MNTSIMEVTPAMAAEFLRLNRINRPLRVSWIRKLAGMIERGEWQLTHQGVAIGADGSLLDGQHRLRAVVLANQAVQMQVTYGCAPAAFLAVDSGIKRTVSDQLRISATAASLYVMLFALQNRMFTGVTPTTQQVANMREWCGETVDRVATARRRTRFSAVPILAATVVHVLDGYDEARAKLEVFAALDYAQMTPSMHALARQITDGTASSSRHRWDLAARAWRAFSVQSEAVTRLTVRELTTPLKEMSDVVQTYARTHGSPPVDRPVVFETAQAVRRKVAASIAQEKQDAARPGP